MRSSSPEPKRSGGVTARPARWTTARAVRRTSSLWPSQLQFQRLKTSFWRFQNDFCVFPPLDGGASLADRESSLDLIKLDISRTFPSLFIFQKVNTAGRGPVRFAALQQFDFCNDERRIWSDFQTFVFALVNHICVSHESLLCLPPAGRSVPRPPPQRAGCLHVLQAWHWLCE